MARSFRDSAVLGVDMIVCEAKTNIDEVVLDKTEDTSVGLAKEDSA